MIQLGLASKGRIHDQTRDYLAAIGAPLKSEGGRSYAARIPALPGAVIWLLPADEIAKRLHAGQLHLGVTGEDLIRERSAIDGKIALVKALGFARADLIVAFPNCWIDVETAEDLRDVFQAIRDKDRRAPHVATKYRNLARAWFLERDITDFSIVPSPGATEAAPMRKAADVIVDITSTGTTLRANDLRPLMSDPILRSQAMLAASLTAPWDEAAFAVAESLLDRIAAARDPRHFVRFPTPDDPETLSRHLEETYGAALAHYAAGGEAGAYVAADVALTVAADIQARTGAAVGIFKPVFVFERPNPLVENLRTQLALQDAARPAEPATAK